MEDTEVHTSSDFGRVETRAVMASGALAQKCDAIIQMPSMPGCETNTTMPQPSPVETTASEELAMQQPMEQHSILPVVAEPSVVAAIANADSMEDVDSTTCDIAHSSTASAHGRDAVGVTPRDGAVSCVDVLQDELHVSAGTNDTALAGESDDSTVACVLPLTYGDTQHDVSASTGKQPCAHCEEAGCVAEGVSQIENDELEARQDTSAAAVHVLTGEATANEKKARVENMMVATAMVERLPAALPGGNEEEESCARN